MSNEYSHSFISSLILGNNFDIDEFDNFTARVNSSSIPLFKNMEHPWSISFEIDENNKLVWEVFEYEYDRREDYMFDSGTIVMNGGISVVFKDTPSDFHVFDLSENNAYEFIECLFPSNSEIVQSYPDANIFFVDGIYYNFDTMKGFDKYIHFEFKK